MPVRITSYVQAFGVILEMQLKDVKLQSFIKRMEKQGHTEKSIAFAVWRSQDKLCAFKRDSRFWSILENEINKWSWRKDDPRWTEYWNKKKEEKRAEALRKELAVEHQFDLIDKAAAKSRKNSKSISKQKGFVYFVQGQCGGAIKIGFSVSPEKRLKELQTGYPDTLKLLLMIPGSELTETAIHRKLEASKLHGEWFRPDDMVIKTMKELKDKFFSQENKANEAK